MSGNMGPGQGKGARASIPEHCSIPWVCAPLTLERPLAGQRRAASSLVRIQHTPKCTPYGPSCVALPYITRPHAPSGVNDKAATIEHIGTMLQ